MQHECSHCGRVFSRHTALRNHMKTHDSGIIDRILDEIAEENTQLVENEEEARNDQIENDDENQEMIDTEELEESINAEEELIDVDEEMINVDERLEEELIDTDEEELDEELNEEEEENEEEGEEELINAEVQASSFKLTIVVQSLL